MTILVVSDSHGDLDALKRAFQQVQPDCVMHLGDHLRDAQRLRAAVGGVPVYAVPGNCDFGAREAPEVCVELQGMRLMLMHGHLYGVKQSPLRAIYAAMQAGAQVLLFGHTHSALCVQREKLLVMNPGACGGRSPTCGVLKLNGTGAEGRIEKVGGKQDDSGN